MSANSVACQVEPDLEFDFQLLQEFRRKGKFCDVYLQPTDDDSKSIFPCHKIVLAAMSPFFRAELEKKDEPNFSIRDLDAETLEILIDYMYSAGKIALPKDNAFRICAGARKLILQKLEMTCVECITSSVTIEKVIQTLLFSRYQNYEELIKLCLNFILGNLQAVKSHGFFQLDADSMHLIVLHQIEDRLLPPEEMLLAVFEWLSVNKEERQEFAYDLFKVMPLTKIRLKILRKVFRDEPFMERNSSLRSLYMDTLEERTRAEAPQYEEKPKPVVLNANSENEGELLSFALPEVTLSKPGLLPLPTIKPREPEVLSPMPAFIAAHIPVASTLAVCNDNFVDEPQEVLSEEVNTTKRKSTVLHPRPELVEEEEERTVKIVTPTERKQAKRRRLVKVQSSNVITRRPRLSSSKSNPSGIETDVFLNAGKVRKALLYFVSKEHARSQYAVVSMDVESREVETLRTYPDFQNSNRLVYHNHKIYSLGCMQIRDSGRHNFVKALDVKSSTWDRNAPNHVPTREGFSSIIVGDYLYAIGGAALANTSQLVERLSLSGSKERWNRLASMSYSHFCPGLCALDGCIYVFGGSAWNQTSKFAPVMSYATECYDPVGDEWIMKRPMPIGRMGHAVAVVGTCIYVLGGSTHLTRGGCHNDDYVVNSVDIYDTILDTWSPGAQMNKKRKDFAAIVFNNCIYAIGGDGDENPTMEKLSFETQKWEDMGGLPINGFFQTATLGIEDVRAP